MATDDARRSFCMAIKLLGDEYRKIHFTPRPTRSISWPRFGRMKTPCHRWGLIRRRSDVCIAACNDVTELSASSHILDAVAPCQYLELDVTTQTQPMLVSEEAIVAATVVGCRTCVRALLNSGVDVNTTSHRGTTALHRAIVCGHCKLAHMLTEEYGADVNRKEDCGNTPLIKAAFKQCAECTRTLLRHKVSTKDVAPLLIAVSEGNQELIEALLDAGMNVNGRNPGENTALHVAATSESHQCKLMTLLVVKYKAKPNVINSSGVAPLHILAQTGCLACVKLLLDNGADGSSPDGKGFPPLITAIQYGHEEVVSYLLRYGVDASAVDKNGFTTLHSAVYYDQCAIAKMLIEEFNVISDGVNNDGDTPLMNAARNGCERCVLLLATRLAPEAVNRKSASGWRALHLAAQKSSCACVAVLLDHGAEIDSLIVRERTALHVAAEKNCADVTELLLCRGACSTVADDKGILPLHIAAYIGQCESIEALLEYGSPIDAIDCLGQTPVHHSVKQKQQAAVEVLLKRGANVKIDDISGFLPLHSACHVASNEIATMLLHYDRSCIEEPTTVDNGAWRPLHVAVQNDSIECVALLLDNGAAINAQSACGSTALQLAILKHSSSIAELLLNRRASITIADKLGWMPLHSAVAEGLTNIAEMIIERDASTITMTTETGLLFPLHCAVAKGQLDCIELLLKKEAPIDARNMRGSTAIHLAVSQQNITTVAKLLEHKASVRIRDNNSLLPLHEACRVRLPEAIGLLLEYDVECIEEETSDGWRPLHIVAEQGCEKCALTLMYYGVDITAVTHSDEKTAVHIAASFGNNDVITLLIKYGASIKVLDGNGWLPLHSASRHKQVSTMKVLLEHNHESEVVNRRTAKGLGSTALHMTAENDSIESIDVLLEYNAEVNSRNSGGYTPLYSASSLGRLDAVRRLLEVGANALDNDNRLRAAPLHTACVSAHLEVVALLIEKAPGVVNMCDEYNETPLHCAVRSNNTKCVEMLLNSGADAAATNVVGETALRLAIKEGKSKSMMPLLKRVPDEITTNARDQYGRTLLHAALEPRTTPDNDETFILREVLLQQKMYNASDMYDQTPLHRIALADTPRPKLAKEFVKFACFTASTVQSQADQRGHTAACYAAMKSSADIVKVFIEECKLPIVAACGGRSMLHSAASGYNVSTTQFLIDKGADICALDDERNTPLHCVFEELSSEDITAIFGNAQQSSDEFVDKRRKAQMETLEILLKQSHVKENIGAANAKKKTPLHIAMNKWTDANRDVVRKLLEAGVAVDSADSDGNSPLHLAVVNKCPRLVDLLLLHNANIRVRNNNDATPFMLASDSILEMLTKAQQQRENIDDTIENIMAMSTKDKKRVLNGTRIKQGKNIGTGSYGSVYDGTWHLPDRSLNPSVGIDTDLTVKNSFSVCTSGSCFEGDAAAGR